jgi:hypothetical protein
MMDDTNETPGIQKFDARYWNAQIQSAIDRHQPFFDAGKESIKLYKAKHELTETKRRLNIWWYCVNTLMPAYYSSTPKGTGKAPQAHRIISNRSRSGDTGAQCPVRTR